jgi:hypothetical protein
MISLAGVCGLIHGDCRPWQRVQRHQNRRRPSKTRVASQLPGMPLPELNRLILAPTKFPMRMATGGKSPDETPSGLQELPTISLPLPTFSHAMQAQTA